MSTKENDKILSLRSPTRYLWLFLLALANSIVAILQYFVFHHSDRFNLFSLVVWSLITSVAYVNYSGRRRAKKRVIAEEQSAGQDTV